jgi:hypothetical protein
MWQQDLLERFRSTHCSQPSLARLRLLLLIRVNCKRFLAEVSYPLSKLYTDAVSAGTEQDAFVIEIKRDFRCNFYLCVRTIEKE